MCSFLNVSRCFFNVQRVCFAAHRYDFPCEFVYFSVSVWVQSEPFFRGKKYLVKRYPFVIKNDAKPKKIHIRKAKKIHIRDFTIPTSNKNERSRNENVLICNNLCPFSQHF